MRTEIKMAILVTVVLSMVPVSLAYVDYNQGNNISSSSGGTLSLYVHDNPVPKATAVYITFTSVSLHGNNTGWENFSVNSRTVNILGLTTTNESLLKTINLQSERYTMIRLYISKVSVMLNGNNITFNLSAPFIFMNRPFNIQDNSNTVISINFQLHQCLNMNSRMFTPFVGYTVS